MRVMMWVVMLLALALGAPLAAQDGGTGTLLAALGDIRAVESYHLEMQIAEIVVEVDAGADVEAVAEALLRVVLADAPDVAELSVFFRGGSDAILLWNAEAGEWVVEQAAEPQAAAAPPVLRISSAEAGLQPVLGPIRLPTGVYIVEATTAGYFIGDVQALAGECTTQSGTLFNLSAGQANSGAETLLASSGCEMLLSISNTREPWTLTFTPFDPAADVRNADDVIASAQEGLYAVIGPVELDDGMWRATVLTSGYLIVDTFTIDGTCDMSRGTLFNLSAGQASDGAQTTIGSEGCSMLIVTSNAREPWAMSFEQLR